MRRPRELSSAELAAMSRQLALVMDSELALTEGLRLVAAQSSSKPAAKMLLRAESYVSEGHSLSEAFEGETGMLPRFYIEMVGVGEQSGNLVRVLNRIADSYEKDASISARVVSAVTYPIILTVLMLCVIVLLLAEVLPMFDEVLSSLGGEMPGLTRVLMDIRAALSGRISMCCLASSHCSCLRAC